MILGSPYFDLLTSYYENLDISLCSNAIKLDYDPFPLLILMGYFSGDNPNFN